MAVAISMISCVDEGMPEGLVPSKRAFDPDKMQCKVSQSPMDTVSSSANELMLTLTVPGSNSATRAKLVRSGASTKYDCEVTIDGYSAGSNPMGAEVGDATRSIYGKNSTNPIACSFLRIDEERDADHTALYTFPDMNHGTIVEGSVIGSPEAHSGHLLRTVVLNPEQSYDYYSQVYSGSLRDTIFYHTRLVGWHPANCTLPTDGKPVEFGSLRYEPYRAFINNKYCVVFDHALDGGTDLVVSNLGEGQRWHSNTAPTAPNRDNRYRDLQKQLPDNHYCLPFGYNFEQEPYYEHPLNFKHYLSAVRVWAKLSQESESSVLNISTWGKIEALTFVDQPSTCTMQLPDVPGDESYGSVVSGSWTDFTNFKAQTGLIYGESDITTPVVDNQVTYPIDMTQSLISMSEKYLGYCLVMPGRDVTIAIQTSAGTYQAVVPYHFLASGASEYTDIFNGGMIYDVVLNLDTKGNVAEFVENEDTGYFEDLSPWDDAAAEFKTANCYIVDVNHVQDRINSEGEYPGFCFIGTVLGNGDEGVLSRGVNTFHTLKASIETPTNAKVLWQSSPSLITNVHLQHGYVRFNVPEARKGNAVIAVTNADGDIDWSWHIWLTDTPGVVTTDNADFMDRNLGAITTTDGVVVPSNAEQAIKLYGLYYQWGRKDPMPGPLKYNQTGGQSMRITPVYNTFNEEIKSMGMYIYNQSQTIEDGIRRPMHYLINQYSAYYAFDWLAQKNDFLWGYEVTTAGGDTYYQKSIYDPCPRGYHVPAEEVQYLAETATSRSNSTYGITLNGVYLPYAGYYGPDRNQSSNDGGAYYCGTKGDYQSSVICSEEDGVDYSYFRNHRLRTYLSSATSWSEPNQDGVPTFSYSAPDHYVTTTVVRTHHDYTNRRTAASVRCVKDKDYELAVTSRITANTTKVSKSSPTPITYSLSGRTNKGTITAATLKLYYTRESDNQLVALQTINLFSEGTAIVTSKTVSGYVTVNISNTDVVASKGNVITARMDIEVKQGSATHTEQSGEVDVSDTTVLEIEIDENSTMSLDDAYELNSNEIRLVKTSDGKKYAPVIGQTVTLTAYVNAPDATVTIDGKAATVNTSGVKELTKGFYYPYTVQYSSTSKGTKTLTITANKTGYKEKTQTFTVPVYGINKGSSEHRDLGNFNNVTLTNGVYQNWYIIRCNWNGNNVYYSGSPNQLDGQLLCNDHTVTYADLFGFNFSGKKGPIVICKASITASVYVGGATAGEDLYPSTEPLNYSINGWAGASWNTYRRLEHSGDYWGYREYISFSNKQQIMGMFKAASQLNIFPVTFSL